MVTIIKMNLPRVAKGLSSLFKGNLMLFLIDFILVSVPDQLKDRSIRTEVSEEDVGHCVQNDSMSSFDFEYADNCKSHARTLHTGREQLYLRRVARAALSAGQAMHLHSLAQAYWLAGTSSRVPREGGMAY